eukprot:2273620-Pyramimonas_sp.AAC.1
MQLARSKSCSIFCCSAKGACRTAQVKRTPIAASRLQSTCMSERSRQHVVHTREVESRKCNRISWKERERARVPPGA